MTKIYLEYFSYQKYLLYVKKYFWLFVSQMCVSPQQRHCPGANFAPPSRIFTDLISLSSPRSL